MGCASQRIPGEPPAGLPLSAAPLLTRRARMREERGAVMGPGRGGEGGQWRDSHQLARLHLRTASQAVQVHVLRNAASMPGMEP